MLRGKTIGSVAVLVGALGLGASAFACTQPPPGPPTIHIVQVGPTTYCIWICNYTTFGANPPASGSFCACAMNKLGVIASIKNIEVFFTAPRPLVGAGVGPPMADPCNSQAALTPVPEWTFNPDPDVGSAYAAFAGTGNWEGLLATTAGFIEDNRPITIKFTINVVPTVTHAQLAAAIQNGSPPFIGTGESDSSGAILGGHAAIRAGVFTVVPALGLVGLAVLGTSMAGAGVFAVRRRAAVTV